MTHVAMSIHALTVNLALWCIGAFFADVSGALGRMLVMPRRVGRQSVLVYHEDDDFTAISLTWLPIITFRGGIHGLSFFAKTHTVSLTPRTNNLHYYNFSSLLLGLPGSFTVIYRHRCWFASAYQVLGA
ncbi:hypothetical protein BDV11DRAFT_150196 [Aspergillus similis]